MIINLGGYSNGKMFIHVIIIIEKKTRIVIKLLL